LETVPFADFSVFTISILLLFQFMSKADCHDDVVLLWLIVGSKLDLLWVVSVKAIIMASS
jgi:hypothetical protein